MQSLKNLINYHELENVLNNRILFIKKFSLMSAPDKDFLIGTSSEFECKIPSFDLTSI